MCKKQRTQRSAPSNSRPRPALLSRVASQPPAWRTHSFSWSVPCMTICCPVHLRTLYYRAFSFKPACELLENRGIMLSQVVCPLANDGALNIFRNHPPRSVQSASDPAPVHRILQGSLKASEPLCVI